MQEQQDSNQLWLSTLFVVQGAIRTKEAFIVTNRVYVMTFLVVLVLAALAPAQTFTTLHNFTGGSDGWGPYAGLIQDSAGDLYGTTSLGGNPNCTPGYGYGCGVVFKLDTVGTETVLHTFWGSDGTNPVAPVLETRLAISMGPPPMEALAALAPSSKLIPLAPRQCCTASPAARTAAIHTKASSWTNPAPCSSLPRSAAHPATGRYSRLKARGTLAFSTASRGDLRTGHIHTLGI